MAKRKTATTATEPSAEPIPTEGTGIAATGAPEADERSKHNAIAEVMENALGAEVETLEEPEGPDPEGVKSFEPDLGPHPTDGEQTVEEDEAEPEEESAPAPSRPAKPTLGERQVALARELGMSDEDIEAGMEDPNAFVEAVGRKYHAKMSELGKLEQRMRSTGETAPAKQPEPSTHTPKAGQEEDEKLDFSFSEDEFGTEEEIGRHNRHLASTKANRLALDELRGELEELVVERRREVADGFFQGLDGEGLEDFGKGPFSQLAENSPEAQARSTLLEEAVNIREYFKLQGRPLPLRDCLERAMHYTYAEQITKAQRQRAGRQVRDSRRRAQARPTQRRSQPLPATDERSKHEEIARIAAGAGVPLAVSKG